MTPPAKLQPGNDALEAQLTALGATVQQGFQRIEQTLLSLDQRLRGLENREAGCQPLINSRLDAAWKTIDELKAELIVMKNRQAADKANQDEAITAQALTIGRLSHSLAVARWIGGLVGGGVVTYIVTQLMGLIR